MSIGQVKLDQVNGLEFSNVNYMNETPLQSRLYSANISRGQVVFTQRSDDQLSLMTANNDIMRSNHYSGFQNGKQEIYYCRLLEKLVKMMQDRLLQFY